MYTSGAYTEQIILAMRRRAGIREVLARYQTKRSAEPDDDEPRNARGEYFPFKPYCASCGRDNTTVTGFDDVIARHPKRPGQQAARIGVVLCQEDVWHHGRQRHRRRCGVEFSLLER